MRGLADRRLGRFCAPLIFCLLVSCTYADDGAVLETTSLLELRGSDPPAGAIDVARNSVIDLYFNVPIAGESAGDVSVRLFSGRIEATGSVSVDQLTRRVRFVPFDELRADLRYRVRVSDRLRGLDGSSLQERIVFDFTTGTRSDATRPSPAAPVADSVVQPLWDSQCSSCHGGPSPALDLDLSSQSAARQTLVGIQSVEVPLLRVAPGRHAESYLMRKLISGSNMSGMRMPPAGDPLGEDALRSVANWIDTTD